MADKVPHEARCQEMVKGGVEVRDKGVDGEVIECQRGFRSE
jgi:hypothetical protein